MSDGEFWIVVLLTAQLGFIVLWAIANAIVSFIGGLVLRRRIRKVENDVEKVGRNLERLAVALEEFNARMGPTPP